MLLPQFARANSSQHIGHTYAAGHPAHTSPPACRRFEGSQCPARLLEEITLVDTPGVLSGEKQRIERNYNFIDACEWFATRCDLILLLFDPYKLDISDEFKQVRWVGDAGAGVCCRAGRAAGGLAGQRLAAPALVVHAWPV